MSNISGQFGSSGSITITLASLAYQSVRQSNVLDLTALISGGPTLDVLLTLQSKITAGAPGGQLAINWYIAPSIDNSTWPEVGSTAATTIGGGDGAYTGSLLNLSPCRAVQFTAQNIKYAQTVSVSTVLGLGKFPKGIVVVVDNETGQSLSATAGDSQLLYQVVYASNT